MLRIGSGCPLGLRQRRPPELVIALAILVLSLLAACDQGAPVSTPPVSTPPGQVARDQPVQDQPEFVAAAKGRIDIEGGVVKLAAKRDGVVHSVMVEEGAKVKAGQVLLVLDDEQARLSAALAQAELGQARTAEGPLQVKLGAAEREVRRLTPLAAKKLVDQRELDRAVDAVNLLQSELAAARAAVETAARKLKVAEFEIEQRVVRAPGDGRIVRRTARPGDGVSTLNVTPLFLFAPDKPRIVRAELEERFLGRVKPGQEAVVTMEADESQHFQATVLRLGLVVGQRTPTDDPNERQDNRVVECVLAIDAPVLLIGQRVIVRFVKAP
jgi:RND family efflux transporter MFP subunit